MPWAVGRARYVRAQAGSRIAVETAASWSQAAVSGDLSEAGTSMREKGVRQEIQIGGGGETAATCWRVATTAEVARGEIRDTSGVEVATESVEAPQ